MSLARKEKKKVKVTAQAKKVSKPIKKKSVKKSTASGLSSVLLKKLEVQLKGQLAVFVKSLARHERKTTALLPADAPEAVNVKQEMDVVERIESQEAQTIRMIQGALRRLKAGAYGRCLTCREWIATQRLLAQPWSVYCVSCKSALEKKR